jgi:hypothetical protein
MTITLRGQASGARCGRLGDQVAVGVERVQAPRYLERPAFDAGDRRPGSDPAVQDDRGGGHPRGFVDLSGIDGQILLSS